MYINKRLPVNIVRPQMKGFTLLEIIVTIVIVSIASTALISAFSTIVKSSADPMLLQQSISIAQSYMDRTALQDFDDITSFSDDPVENILGESNILNDYSATLVVDDTTSFLGIAAGDIKQITVTVRHNSNAIDDFELTGYRTNY